MSEDKRRFGQAQISEVIAPKLRPLFKKYGMGGAQIMANWHEIVGHPLSSICVPEKVRFNGEGKTGGTLILRVVPGWTLEIQHQSHVIMERISTFLGYSAISAITIRQDHNLGVRKPTAKSARKLSPEQQEKLADIVKNVTNDKLRESLVALGSRVL